MLWISWFSVFVYLIVLFLIHYVQDLRMEILLRTRIGWLLDCSLKLNVILQFTRTLNWALKEIRVI